MGMVAGEIPAQGFADFSPHETPVPSIGDQMTRSEVINDIDQLHAVILDVFGKSSESAKLVAKLYKTAEQEDAEIEEEVGPDDREEFELAHASGRIGDARAINSARGRF